MKPVPAADHPIELFFSERHPLSRHVKASFTGSRGDTVRVSVEAPAAFVGEISSGTLHSGFATIVLDSIMGGAVMGVLTKITPIATVGLSCHHLRRPKQGEKLRGEAVCRRVHNDLAYVTGELRTETGEVLAFASGTFMTGTRATPIRERDSAQQRESRI